MNPDANYCLVIVAHPDDEILGCGGTMARLAAEGKSVYVHILGEGLTSRDKLRQPDIHAEALSELARMAKQANTCLGVKEVSFSSLPDNRFDSIDLIEVVKEVENVVERISPSVVFTHHAYDMNIDHQITNKAVLTALRPYPGQKVREIYAFSVLSSTEWNVPVRFSPSCFVDINSYLDLKKKAMSVYAGELRSWPHPRSLQAIEHEARLRGSYVGFEAAEAFECLRLLR